jgi:hypothetical protein
LDLKGEDRSWRNFHNDELHNLYSSSDIVRVIKSRRMNWAGHVARMGERRGAYSILVGRIEVKSPVGRPRRMWKNNFNTDLREIGIDGANWIQMSQCRDRNWAFVNTIMKFRVPYRKHEFLTN